MQDIRSLKLYIRYLRQKIEPDPAEPRYILTEWGVGYRFREVPATARPNPAPANPPFKNLSSALGSS